VRAETPHDAVLGSAFDSMLFVYTDRKAIRPFPYAPGELFYGVAAPASPLPDFERMLRVNQVSYLVRTPMPHFAEERVMDRLVDRAVHERPSLLEAVYVGRDPRFLVFRVRPGPLP
jgi:hypothetical protein